MCGCVGDVYVQQAYRTIKIQREQLNVPAGAPRVSAACVLHSRTRVKAQHRRVYPLLETLGLLVLLSCPRLSFDSST